MNIAYTTLAFKSLFAEASPNVLQKNTSPVEMQIASSITPELNQMSLSPDQGASSSSSSSSNSGRANSPQDIELSTPPPRPPTPAPSVPVRPQTPAPQNRERAPTQHASGRKRGRYSNGMFDGFDFEALDPHTKKQKVTK